MVVELVLKRLFEATPVILTNLQIWPMLIFPLT
jgi:hypothetical protein